MPIRVAHWGAGGTGRHGLRGVIGHPELELVGVVVQRPENAGRDAGDLCALGPTGIIATNSVEEVLALKPDCLSYFGAGIADTLAGVENVARFLEAGIDVVTTSFSSLVHAQHAPAAQRDRVAEACAKGGSSFFATGVEPGFTSDIIPMTLLSATERLDSLRVSEISTYAYYPVEYPQREVLGFGKPLDYEPLLTRGDQLTEIWGPVVRGMADAVGVKLDGLRQWHEFGVTSHDLDTAFGRVDAGTRSAVRFAVEGMYGGKPIVALEHVSFLSEEMPEHWPRPTLGAHTVYRVEIEGRPPTRLEVAYGLVDGVEQALIATAMRAINAIPAVVEAPPGALDPHHVPATFSGHVRGR